MIRIIDSLLNQTVRREWLLCRFAMTSLPLPPHRGRPSSSTILVLIHLLVTTSKRLKTSVTHSVLQRQQKTKVIRQTSRITASCTRRLSTTPTTYRVIGGREVLIQSHQGGSDRLTRRINRTALSETCGSVFYQQHKNIQFTVAGGKKPGNVHI